MTQYTQKSRTIRLSLPLFVYSPHIVNTTHYLFTCIESMASSSWRETSRDQVNSGNWPIFTQLRCLITVHRSSSSVCWSCETRWQNLPLQSVALGVHQKAWSAGTRWR